MKTRKFIALFLTLVFVLTSVPILNVAAGDVPQTTVSIDNPALQNVAVGKTLQMYAVVTPYDSPNREIRWKSSKSAIVTVDANGLVTGKKSGMAIITATTADGTSTSSTTVRVGAGLPLPVDAYLSDLRVNGTMVAHFQPAYFTYSATLPEGETPNIEALPVDKQATVKIALPESLPGTATVTVTGSDKKKTATYTVDIRVDEPGEPQGPGFPVYRNGSVVDIYVDAEDHKQIVRAVGDLQKDILAVTEQTPTIKNTSTDLGRNAIIVGSVDESVLIKELMASGKLEEAKALDGKWESYIIKIVDKPIAGVDRALVIAGSDKRGAVYGIYDVSEQIGVSPWYYWGDIIPQVQDEIVLTQTLKTEGEPSVKYRGIFVNDEQNLMDWAKINDPKGLEGGNIGPETYKKIYELLLRLRGNYLWPGMHSENRLGPVDHFNKYPENRELADEYGIVVGTSHCEPMMRNGTAEWGPFLQSEGYLQGVDLSKVSNIDDLNNKSRYPDTVIYDYSYPQNRPIIDKYWDENVKTYKDLEVSYTLGMRGLHDRGFRTDNASSNTQKLKILQDIVDSQVKMMETNEVNPDAFPIFIPYKEVLPLYEMGLELPDDAVIVWAEDNHGYIRRFPTEAEKAHSGVYYHVSYVGVQTYLWMNSTPPALILSEMGKAYESGARELWVLNVGDIKPSEIGMDFFLDIAWDIDKWDGSNLKGDEGYLANLSEKWFPDADSTEVSKILDEYYHLNYSRKPEHTTLSTSNGAVFDPSSYGDESMQRLADYQDLMERADAVHNALPTHQQDAFYQIVSYPIKGAYYNNLKYFYAQKNALYIQQGRGLAANLCADMVTWAQDMEDQATRYYNKEISGGKWDQIMQPYNRTRGMQSSKPGASKITNVPYMSSMGTVVEGELLETEKSELKFSTYLEDTHYIDLFNKGSKSFDYTVEASEEWVLVSESTGTIYDEQRLFVEIDWSNLPTGDQTAQITIKGAGREKIVQVSVNNPALSLSELSGYAEANGYVAIEAEHYTEEHKDGDTGFFVFDGLGRSGSSISAGPMGVSNYDGALDKAPYVSYDVYFQSQGSFKTTVYRVPTLSAEGQRFAIGVDNNTPTVMHGQNVAEAGNWTRNVTNGTEKMTITLEISEPGYHTIKLYMIDAGVGVDRIVIDTGGEQSSNQGPPESYHSEHNQNPDVLPKLLSMHREYLEDYMSKVEAIIAGLEPEEAKLLQTVLDEVKSSLAQLDDDTVRRGYARLADAVQSIDIFKNIDQLLVQALQMADNILGGSSIGISQEALDVFGVSVKEIKERLSVSGITAAEKLVCYDDLWNAISKVQGNSNISVTASNFQEGNLPANAIDMDSGTRWASASSSYPQWIEVDLGEAYLLEQIQVDWYNPGNRYYKYTIKVSEDGSNYTTVADHLDNNSLQGSVTDVLQGNPLARYVRIDVVGSNGGNTSLYEIKISGKRPGSGGDDDTLLGDAIAIAEQVDQSKFTVDSYANMMKMVRAGKAALQSGADEETQQKCLDDLQDASRKLVSRKYVVEDTFDDLETIEGLVADWSLIQTGGNVTIVQENENRYLKIEQTAKSNTVEARRSFAETSGKIYIEAKVRSDTPSNFFGAPFLYKNDTSSTILGAVALRDNGQIRTTYQGNNSSSMIQVGTFETGQWNTVSLIVDTATQKMQVYVNGVQVEREFSMRNQTDAIGMLRFYSDDSNTTRPMQIGYVDDVFVYQEGDAIGEIVVQELQEAIRKAESFVGEDYTLDSYNNLHSAVLEGKEILETGGSDDAVIGVTERIILAIEHLKERQYIVDDSFDDLDTIDDLSEGWSLIETGGVVTLEEGANANKYLQFTQEQKGSGLSVEANRNFGELSGKVYVEAKVRSDTPQSFVGVPYMYQNSSSNTILAAVALRDNGQVVSTYRGNNNGSQTQIGSFNSGEWNTIGLILDSTTQKMQVYLNGEHVGKDFEMRNPLATLGMLRFYSDDNSASRPNAIGCIDDLRVYVEAGSVQDNTAAVQETQPEQPVKPESSEQPVKPESSEQPVKPEQSEEPEKSGISESSGESSEQMQDESEGVLLPNQTVDVTPPSKESKKIEEQSE